MTLNELVTQLQHYPPDSIIVVSGPDNGWSNVEKVVQDGACVKIVMDFDLIFSDE